MARNKTSPKVRITFLLALLGLPLLLVLGLAGLSRWVDRASIPASQLLPPAELRVRDPNKEADTPLEAATSNLPPGQPDRLPVSMLNEQQLGEKLNPDGPLREYFALREGFSQLFLRWAGNGCLIPDNPHATEPMARREAWLREHQPFLASLYPLVEQLPLAGEARDTTSIYEVQLREATLQSNTLRMMLAADGFWQLRQNNEDGVQRAALALLRLAARELRRPTGERSATDERLFTTTCLLQAWFDNRPFTRERAAALAPELQRLGDLIFSTDRLTGLLRHDYRWQRAYLVERLQDSWRSSIFGWNPVGMHNAYYSQLTLLGQTYEVPNPLGHVREAASAMRYKRKAPDTLKDFDRNWLDLFHLVETEPVNIVRDGIRDYRGILNSGYGPAQYSFPSTYMLAAWIDALQRFNLARAALDWQLNPVAAEARAAATERAAKAANYRLPSDTLWLDPECGRNLKVKKIDHDGTTTLVLCNNTIDSLWSPQIWQQFFDRHVANWGDGPAAIRLRRAEAGVN